MQEFYKIVCSLLKATFMLQENISCSKCFSENRADKLVSFFEPAIKS